MHPRVIPCLLLQNQGLVKTIKFRDPVYIGDPINAVRIFTEKMTDELIFLDIEASKNGTEPDFEFLNDIVNEAFMPFTYGGGISSVGQVERLLKMGIEKVCINSSTYDNPEIISESVKIAGSSSIVAAVDVKRNSFGAVELFSKGGLQRRSENYFDYTRKLEDLGAGELLVNSINNDGVMKGYDYELIKKTSSILNIPVIACGGAGGLGDIAKVLNDCGASAAAAGSIFVFYGKMKGVLINYPDFQTIESILG